MSSCGGVDLIFFLKDPANFFSSPGSGKNFPTRPERFGKTENVNLINLPKNAMEPKENDKLSPLSLV